MNTVEDSLQPQILLEGGNERAVDVEERSNYGGPCPGARMCVWRNQCENTEQNINSDKTNSIFSIENRCVPMSECQAMYYEVAKSCYNGNRELYCGGTQYEPYICCPKSPLEHNSVCGKTLVSGQFYRGLGAFPFVARVGFKSLYSFCCFCLKRRNSCGLFKNQSEWMNCCWKSNC